MKNPVKTATFPSRLFFSSQIVQFLMSFLNKKNKFLENAFELMKQTEFKSFAFGEKTAMN